MSHNRIATTLEEVKPTKTVGFKSFLCERRAADIRNQAVAAMNRDNTDAVSYRYLQSREGENTTFYNARNFGISSSLVLACVLYINHELTKNDELNIVANMVIKCVFGIVLLANLTQVVYCIANVNNTRRYKETKEGCEAWLKNKVGVEKLNTIKKLNYWEYKESSAYEFRNTDNEPVLVKLR